MILHQWPCPKAISFFSRYLKIIYQFSLVSVLLSQTPDMYIRGDSLPMDPGIHPSTLTIIKTDFKALITFCYASIFTKKRQSTWTSYLVKPPIRRWINLVHRLRVQARLTSQPYSQVGTLISLQPSLLWSQPVSRSRSLIDYCNYEKVFHHWNITFLVSVFLQINNAVCEAKLPQPSSSCGNVVMVPIHC